MLLHIFLLQYCQTVLRLVNNTQNNRKNSKGASFFKHSVGHFGGGKLKKQFTVRRGRTVERKTSSATA